ncbi:hypothetical protein D9758_001557 [Tetrapyrgos nigripes]|uniref:Major facilitator superfamily (MFS) profile domain-containing protein n=1 Tax=Tetrapyrgos nigripes TaxID=182062 RepID=A0A8H5LX85_9AGAR|nr:hypothetical protein D9758_001557 [Tetrapyrgos nigripes]
MIGPSLFSKEYLKPLGFCAVAVIGAVLYGYDGTYFTSILAMDKFGRDFGELQSDGSYAISSSDKSLFTSIVQAGEVVGALTAGPIGDYTGRKGALAAACTFVIIGVILQMVVAGSHPLLIVGRLILGMGVGVISNAVPLYLSEIPPTEIRGVVVSSWQLMLAIGQVIGACVGQGTKELNSTAAYRIPIALNLVFILSIYGGLLWLPESPRWLFGKNKTEKMYRALERIHQHHPNVEGAIQEQTVAFEESRKREVDNGGNTSRWTDLVFGTTRRRFICAVGILISQQISGVQFIFSYATVFFQDLHIASPFIITIVVDIVEVVGVIVSFFLVNRFGRRPLLLWTGAGMTIVLLICGGMGVKSEAYRQIHPEYNQVAAAMIIIYVFLFNLAWGPLCWVVATELSVGRNRQKIMSVGTACFWTMAFVVTFTLPYLFDQDKAALGPMIGFIYGGLCFLTLVFVYFCIPETRGRTLEEINFLMEAEVPTKEWDSYDLATKVALSEKSKARSRFAGEQEFVEYYTGPEGAKVKEVNEEGEGSAEGKPAQQAPGCMLTGLQSSMKMAACSSNGLGEASLLDAYTQNYYDPSTIKLQSRVWVSRTISFFGLNTDISLQRDMEPTVYPFKPSLMTSNALPEEKDIYHIRQICLEYTQDLDRMNAQIERLKTSLDAITQKRDSLQEKVASLKSITSPLRSLPTEILQHIFLHSLPPFSTFDRVQSPINVAQTCSRWRPVAIGTPELWAAFHIFVPEAAYTFDPQYTSKCNALREGLECFLSRSGSLPLSISLYSSNSDRWHDDVAAVTGILEILLPHHRRWKHLHLRIPYDSLFALEHIRGEDLVCLEAVSLYGSPSDTRFGISDIVPSTFLENAPSLRQLDLPQYGVSYELSAASMARLTHLVMTRPLEDAALMDMLANCVNLVELSVSSYHDFSADTSPITLSALQKLIVYCNLAHSDLLFNRLTLPNLRELTLKENFPESDHWSRSLLSLENLFMRSSCSLTKFELQCSIVSSFFPALEPVISFFKSLPDLNQLVLLKNPFMTEELLKALTVVSSSDVLLPKLTRIEFHDHYTFPEQALLDFLSARLPPPLRPTWFAYHKFRSTMLGAK